MSSIKRPLIFLGVGGVNTLLDFICYSLLVHLIGYDSSSILLVGIISGTIALIIAYTTHRLITWRDRKTTKSSIIKFFIATGFGLWVIRPLLLFLFIKFNSLYIAALDTIERFTDIALSYNFVASTGAFLMMTVILMIYNYLTYNNFVFPKKTSTDLEIH